MLKLFLVIQAATAQTPATVTLTTPNSVFPVDFTQIRGTRELSDGRVIISDRLDKGVVVADFARGTIATIGRTGSGPAEYRIPTTLNPMPGDSTMLSDEGNQRMAVIGPDLRIHRSFNLMIPGLGVPLGARTTDLRGRYYLSIPGWVNGPRGGSDSVVVIRFDDRTQRVDTLAVIKGSTPRQNTQRPGMGQVIFAPQDVWNVTPEGRLVIVRAGDYHVEWRNTDGKVTSGPPIAFDRRAVTMEDRVEYIKRFLAGASISGKGADQGLSPLPAEMQGEKRAREMAEYHEHATEHPPFNATTPLFGLDGSLWVERDVRLGQPQTWDVIGQDGKVKARVQMPRGRRLQSLSARWIYAVNTDEDGLQHLERYAHPSLAGR
jgi:hypothetical protein